MCAYSSVSGVIVTHLPWRHVVLTYMAGGSCVFEAVPCEGYRCHLIRCSSEVKAEVD
jgi:hypothetical protein